LPKWKHFNLTTKLKILPRIIEYHTKVNKIDELLAQYKWSNNELLKYVYWKTVKWKIEVERESSGIIFYINNEDEYIKINGSDKSAWLKTGKSNISELRWSIAFVRWKNKWKWSESNKIKNHEARHTFNDIILKDNDLPLSGWKDEIIAYLSEWKSFNDIKNTLTDENWLYNYFEYKKWSDEYEKLWKNYKEKISLYIDEAIIIKKLFPKNYLNILSVFDIKEWKILIEKVSESDNNKIIIDTFNKEKLADLDYWENTLNQIIELLKEKNISC